MSSRSKRLVLITGSPRSTTTAFHNALIEAGIFSGVLADDSVPTNTLDVKYHTDEYYPSMRASILYQHRREPILRRSRAMLSLRKTVGRLRQEFPSEFGLMLKAPHYVFGLDAFRRGFSKNLRVIYIHRCPFAIASSMLKHQIRDQLMLSFASYPDFPEFDIIERFSDNDAFLLARNMWDAYSPFERALFIWHVYANAFVTGADHGSKMTFVFSNHEFDNTTVSNLSELLSIPKHKVQELNKFYRSLPHSTEGEWSLSPAGKTLWRTIGHLDTRLKDIARSLQ